MFTYTESELTEKHRAEIRAFTAEHGWWHTKGPLWDAKWKLLENQRLDWVRFVEERDGGAGSSTPRGPSKQDNLLKFVALNPGWTGTVEALMGAASCSRGTAYSFVRDNAGMFRKTALRGVYEITAEGSERARTLIGAPAALPFPTSTADEGTTTAEAESEIAMRAVRLMAGELEES